jgi:hypothetical protein
MTAVFGVLQALLMFFFGSATPSELIEKGLEEEAKQIIEKFYVPECREEVYNEYKQEVLM